MKKSNLITTILLLVITVAFSFVTTKVDVADIGPCGTSIGLSAINGRFAEMVGFNMTWYRIADVLGIIVIFIFLTFAFMGLMQLIKRKNLLKVDHNILELGGLYLTIFILYVIFEKAIINYRPVIMPGETFPEASFPSSHTMMALVVVGGALMQLNKYIKKASTRNIVRIDLIVIMVLTILARTLSGAHWLTDIIASILISATLLMIYVTVDSAVSEG